MENKQRKRNYIIAGAVALVLVAAGIVYAVLSPKYYANDLTKQVNALEDYDFVFSVDAQGNETNLSAKVEGTLLRSASQLEFSTVIPNEDDLELGKVIIDGDDLYLDTRAFLSATGRYWLGDVNGNDYFRSIYDSIFSSAYTLFSLEGYEVSPWNDGKLHFSELKTNSSILKEEALNAILEHASFKHSDSVYRVALSAEQTAAAIDEMMVGISANNETLYDNLTNAATAYSVEIAQHSSIFASNLADYFSALAQERKDNREEGIAAQTAYFEKLADWAKGNHLSVAYEIGKDGDAFTQTVTLTADNDSVTLTAVRSPSYKTYLDSIPADYEEFGVQMALLEDAFGTVFGLGNIFEDEKEEVPTVNVQGDEAV